MAWLFQFLFLLTSQANAEYRVFRLEITGPKGPVRSVLSTLDPEQYVRYYPVERDQKVSYTETWMCKDRTSDFRPVCPNPKAPPAPRLPASE